MVEQPKESDQIDMVLRNLHPIFAQHLVGIIFQNFQSLIHIIFNVEEGISRGLWTDSSPLDPMGKKPISSSRSLEVDSISQQEWKRCFFLFLQTVQTVSCQTIDSSGQVLSFVVLVSTDLCAATLTLQMLLPSQPQQLYMVAQTTTKPIARYARVRPSQPKRPPTHKSMRQFSDLGMPLS